MRLGECWLETRVPSARATPPPPRFEYANTFGQTCTSCVDEFNQSVAAYSKSQQAMRAKLSPNSVDQVPGMTMPKPLPL